MSKEEFKRGKVFRDPVHDLIRIEEDDEFLLDLINTPEFQRLRRVKQLGVSWMTYPGAEHSRFVHSLGVLAFAQRMLLALKRRYPEGTVHSLIQSHERTVKAAALLHDIGHGPFSHVVERAFGKKKHHEHRTAQLIGAENGNVFKVLKNSGVPAKDVRAIIDGVWDFGFLQDIVSSQLDADRMDYILRDAHSTGVRYGSYDSEWILNSLCVGLDPSSPVGETGVEQLRLCLESRRGLHSAEQLIMARFHMSMQVYFHRTTRGWEAHLLLLLNEALKLVGNLPEGTPGIIGEFLSKSGDVSNDVFIQLDDVVLTSAMQAWSVSRKAEHVKLAALARQFLQRNKALLRKDLSPLQVSPEKKIILQSCLERHAGPEGHSWYLDDASVEIYKYMPMTNGTKPGDDSLKTKSILLSSGAPEANAVPFESASHIFSELYGSQKQVLSRVYFLPEVTEAVSKAFSEADDPMIEFQTP